MKGEYVEYAGIKTPSQQSASELRAKLPGQIREITRQLSRNSTLRNFNSEKIGKAMHALAVEMGIPTNNGTRLLSFLPHIPHASLEQLRQINDFVKSYQQATSLSKISLM